MAPPMCDQSDARVVERQCGRPMRGSWRCAVRCRFGRPQVIATASSLEDGTPFPTLYWLTCPWLVGEVGALESKGGAARAQGRLAADRGLARRMLEADAAYRAERAVASGGTDACASVGFAGQSDPLAVKCLHAHVAALLAGLDDPVGEGVASALRLECAADMCGDLPQSGRGGCARERER